MKKVFGSLIAMLLLVSLAAADNVTIETNKTIYSQGEIVQFTIYNNNSGPLEKDFKWSILDNNTGKCVWDCIWSAIYAPIIVPSGENYSWTWNQKVENGTASTGYYKGVLDIYYSNVFEITSEDKMLTYYRGLGQYPDIVETNDLLNAAGDWRNNVIPPGFTVSITTSQLLSLAEEWRNS